MSRFTALPQVSAARRGRPSVAVRLMSGAAIILAAQLAGCSPDRVLGSSLPPNIPDPGLTHTPAGAISAYYGAIVAFRTAVGGGGQPGAVGGNPSSYIPLTALFTDELGSSGLGTVGYIDDYSLIDSRSLFAGGVSGATNNLYQALQIARGQTEEARGLLRAYDPDSLALLGHLDVIEGFSEVYLAEFFCSGVPLSTVDYNGDWTLKPGSTTQDVYANASVLFDSALTLAADSSRFLNAARVGQGRAQLDLGNYAAAAQAVATVPTGFAYALTFSTNVGAAIYDNRNFAFGIFGGASTTPSATMVDREGGNGLPFMSSGDPRSAWLSIGTSATGYPIYAPSKYDLAGDSSVVLASGVEARLIEAEAALQAGSAAWLTTLNDLRTDGTFDTMPDSLDLTKTDTLWHAGGGGVAGLAPLADPGTKDGRVDLLFSERGYWLFLTGHRQGDLRRLVRQYGRLQNTVYPSGTYNGASGAYGSDVTAPFPIQSTYSGNQLNGCQSRGA